MGWLALGGTVPLGAALALGWLLWRQSRRRRRTEERFRQLSNAVPQIVFMADRRGHVQFVSYRWVEVTGLRIAGHYLYQLSDEDWFDSAASFTYG